MEKCVDCSSDVDDFLSFPPAFSLWKTSVRPLACQLKSLFRGDVRVVPTQSCEQQTPRPEAGARSLWAGREVRGQPWRTPVLELRAPWSHRDAAGTQRVRRRRERPHHLLCFAFRCRLNTHDTKRPFCPLFACAVTPHGVTCVCGVCRRPDRALWSSSSRKTNPDPSPAVPGVRPRLFGCVPFRSLRDLCVLVRPHRGTCSSLARGSLCFLRPPARSLWPAGLSQRLPSWALPGKRCPRKCTSALS